MNDNLLTGAELAKLAPFTESLAVLKLGNNKISSFDDIKHLQNLKHLTKLELLDNEVANQEGYKDKIFEMLPQLKILDGKDKDNVSMMSEDDAEEEGEFEMD